MQQQLATLAFSLLAAQAAAQSGMGVTLSHEDGCRQLFMPSCTAQRNNVELRKNRSNGYTVYGYERFTEAAHHNFLEWHGSALRNHLHAGATASWQLQLSGQRLTWQRGFALNRALTAEVGAYLGKLDGTAGLSAQAYARQDELRFLLPANPLGVTRVTIPAHSVQSEYVHSRAASSPYGGLTQALQLTVPLSPSWQMQLKQTAQAGADKAFITLGAQIQYSGKSWQAALGTHAQKTLLDPLYDRIHDKSEQIAGKINTYLMPVSSRLADTPYAIRSVTGADVRRALDIESPYAQLDTRLQLAFSVQLGKTTLRVQHSEPLKASPSIQPRTAVALGYTF
jgi:hypothetical protein